MIQSKEDLKYYIAADLKSLGLYPLTAKMRIEALLTPAIWKYEVIMRKMEYVANCKNGPLAKVHKKILSIQLANYGNKLGGIEVPINICGPGLCICHKGTLIINSRAHIDSDSDLLI